jgi:hypothetical protein
MADNPQNKTAGSPIGEFGDILLQNQYNSPEKKKDKAYGRELLTRIFKEQNNQSSSFYFAGRNRRWVELWSWAYGRQNMNEFADYVSTEGNKAWTPVDMTPNRVGVQMVETLINSMSQNEEYPCVTAIDKASQEERERMKYEALFRMSQIEKIKALQDVSGMQLEPDNVFVPDDALSAEVYFKLEARLPKEIMFEEKIETGMLDNQYDQKKRQTLRDLIAINCSATKIEKDDNGYIKIRKCTAANLLYNFFMSDSGKLELSYIGEMYTMKIKDIRRKYGKSESNPNGLSEQELFNLGKNANQLNIANRFFYLWNNSYLYATDRPYDDYGVNVFDCEVQSVDADYYVAKKDKFGKENITSKKSEPKPQSEETKVIKTNKLTVYRGILAIDSNIMIYWGLPDVVIKPFMNISESLFSYSIQIPNNDGDYVPSLFERALSPLRKYTLADLKIKQIIANLRPPGITIDIEQIRDIDLGAGNTISGMEVIKMYNQSGIVVWSSKGLNPLEKQDIPIKEIGNAASLQQLTELMNIKNDSMQEIRSVLGVPLYRDGSDLPPRMGAAVVENQTASSNNVTDYIMYANKHLWEETFYKYCILEWDDVVLKNNNVSLMDTVFTLNIELKPTAYEKAQLEQNIQIAMKSVDATGQPLLNFKDAFKIRNIKNYKVSEMYLANMVQTNQRRAAQEKQKDQQANIQSQQQSAQQAQQGQMAMQQQEMAAKKEMTEYEFSQKKQLAFVEGLMQIYAKGLQPPAEWQQLVKNIIPNLGIPIANENAEMVQEHQQEAAHQMATQMTQQQMQQEQQGQQPQGQPMQQNQPQQ